MPSPPRTPTHCCAALPRPLHLRPLPPTQWARAAEAVHTVPLESLLEDLAGSDVSACAIVERYKVPVDVWSGGGWVEWGWFVCVF